MLFKWNFMIEAHVINIPDNEEWHLGCTLDEKGMPVIFLETATNSYMVANGFEYIHTNSERGLNAGHVSRFYFEVVKEVYNIIESYGPSCVDISEVKADMLSEFWGAWKSHGYVSCDDEPADLVF